MTEKNALLYFVKYPEPGKVKTRLAKVIGDHEAARVYRELAETNLRILDSLPTDFVKVIIAFDPFEKEAAMRSWLPSSYEYLAQGGAELGERLQNAFQFAFKNGFKKVIALGSDTLELKLDLILRGFETLECHDVVVGPAHDGGYYLIGMNREHPAIFNNIPWSSPHVFESTINKLTGKNLSYSLLPKLDDLDEVKNLRGGNKIYEIFK